MTKRLTIHPRAGILPCLLALVLFACGERVAGSRDTEGHGGASSSALGGKAIGTAGATIDSTAGASNGGLDATGGVANGQAGSPTGIGTGNAGASPLGECFPSNLATPNVVVLGDASPTGATTKGRLWVGGNLTTNASYGVNASGTGTTSCDDYGLIVGGNIAGDAYVEAGATAYAGTFTGSQSGPCEARHANPIDFAALKRQIENFSTALRSLPVTGTISLESDYLVFTGASTSLNVFSVDATDFTGNNLRFSVPPNSSILVNVNGAAVTWIGKGFSFPDGPGSCLSGTSTWCHRILYNFHDATSLEVAGVAVQGTVLAPLATLDAGCGNVDGQVFVYQLKGGYEYMPYAFTGCLEPS